MTYEYQCPKCEGIWELQRPVDERDDPYVCSMCDKKCARVVSKGSFIIRGFSEKNGYSDYIGNMMPKHLRGRKYE